jgi:hypothetical protein
MQHLSRRDIGISHQTTQEDARGPVRTALRKELQCLHQNGGLVDCRCPAIQMCQHQASHFGGVPVFSFYGSNGNLEGD